MNGQRFIIKKIGGSFNEFQFIEESKTGFARTKIEGKHSAGLSSKLRNRQLMKLIAGKSVVIYRTYLS